MIRTWLDNLYALIEEHPEYTSREFFDRFGDDES
jgi:hypothetical protein